MINLDRKVVKLSNGLGDEWAGARRRNMEKWKDILQLFADDGAAAREPEKVPGLMAQMEQMAQKGRRMTCHSTTS